MPNKFEEDILFISQNRGKNSLIEPIFLKLRKEGMIKGLIAKVFVVKNDFNAIFFLLATFKNWNYLTYNDWLIIIDKVKGDKAALRKMISFFYEFCFINFIPIILNNGNIKKNIKEYLKKKFFIDKKIRTGISVLFSFHLSDEEIESYCDIKRKDLKVYGQKLINTGAKKRDINEEKVGTLNSNAKIAFEDILKKVDENLRSAFYEYPSLYKLNLLNRILKNIDDKMASDFLNENPFLRKRLSKIDDKWLEETNTPWFLKDLTDKRRLS